MTRWPTDVVLGAALGTAGRTAGHTATKPPKGKLRRSSSERSALAWAA